MNSNIIFQLRSILQSAQNILIALPQEADDDAIGAGLALFLILKKMRKQASIVSSGEIRVAQAHFYGIDKIGKQVSGGNTLVISLPYKEGSIEKVISQVEGDRMNLVIEPRGERLTFSPDEIEYNFGKGDYDAVFVIGARDFNALGSLYTKHQNSFSEKQIVNIDNDPKNSNFGQINIVQKGSICLTLAIIFKALRLPIDQDPASNLYTGIVSKEGSIQLDTASPDLLESIAYLLRSNAQILSTREQKTQTHEQILSKGTNANLNKQPMPVDENLEETPEDWLKPKIFSSRNN